MSKVHFLPISLATTVAAVGILLAYAALNHAFGYETTIGGLTLLLVLFAFDEEGYRPAFQSFAFACVGGMCVMVFSVYPVVLLMQPKSPDQWALGLWVAGTLLFFAVDRMRATSRETTAYGLSAVPAAYTPAAYAPPVSTPPVYQQAAPVRPVQPVAVAPPPPVTAPVTPIPVTSAEPEPVYREEVAAAPAPAAAAMTVAPIPPGREAQIFLNLLGEGLNVLRSVKAEHLGRDYYRIADIMPEGERWEYQPGQVVRARKKSLSTGKHLVAFEEAQRAQ
jgi:hypothetical protein